MCWRDGREVELTTGGVCSRNKREKSRCWAHTYDFKQKMTSYWVSGW